MKINYSMMKLEFVRSISRLSKLFIIFIAVLHGIPENSFSQKKLSIEDAVIGPYRGLSPKNLDNLKWSKDNIHFSYVKDYQYLIKTNTADLSESSVLDILEVNDANNLDEDIKFKYLSGYSWIDENRVVLYTSRVFAVIDISKGSKAQSLFVLPDEAENPDFSAKANMVTYTINGKLFLLDSKGHSKLIAGSDKDGFVYGEYVSRSEFGITKGTFWSPEGKKLAFYRKDERQVTNYPLVNIEKRIAGVENIRYPMAGEASENVALGIYDISTGSVIYVEEDTISEKYLTNITWSPGGEAIYIAILNRGQDSLRLNRYNAETGEFDVTLLEEVDTKYVEPEHGPVFFEGLNDKFIWFSERDGFNHLYLYDTGGKLIKQLTRGDWLVKKIIGYNDAEDILFAEATIESPLENHIIGVDLKKDNINVLSPGEGYHTGSLSENGAFIIDNYQSPSVPRKIYLYNPYGKKQKVILEASDPLADYELGEMDIFTIKADDNTTDLYCRIIKPAGYDKQKKYPVILHVYGGPHNQMITKDWLGGAGLWDFYMAQEGYIMLTVDNRGSENRGFAFESIIHRKLGQTEMRDQMQGIQYLNNLPYADTSRIGVYGWSYGGFMCINLMLTYPQIFKTGVAGGPVTDWKFYEVMYGERYMDTPGENPEGYEAANLNKRIGDLKGRLLIVHGGIDPTVVWQNSLTFLNSAVKEGVLVDYFVYPRHEHNVRGYDRIHLRKLTVRYFNDFLKPTGELTP